MHLTLQHPHRGRCSAVADWHFWHFRLPFVEYFAPLRLGSATRTAHSARCHMWHVKRVRTVPASEDPIWAKRRLNWKLQLDRQLLISATRAINSDDLLNGTFVNRLAPRCSCLLFPLSLPLSLCDVPFPAALSGCATTKRKSRNLLIPRVAVVVALLYLSLPPLSPPVHNASAHCWCAPCNRWRDRRVSLLHIKNCFRRLFWGASNAASAASLLQTHSQSLP